MCIYSCEVVYSIFCHTAGNVGFENSSFSRWCWRCSLFACCIRTCSIEIVEQNLHEAVQYRRAYWFRYFVCKTYLCSRMNQTKAVYNCCILLQIKHISMVMLAVKFLGFTYQFVVVVGMPKTEEINKWMSMKMIRWTFRCLSCLEYNQQRYLQMAFWLISYFITSL